MSYYDIIGVPPTATRDEIHRAYQSRARLLHPDRHASASAELLAVATTAVAQLNEAWQVLGNEASRSRYDRSLGESAGDRSWSSRQGQPRAPHQDECSLCGYSPAAVARLRWHVGKILLPSMYTIDGSFCRSCGIATFRQAMNRTLWAGWWWLFGYIANVFVVVANLNAYRTLRSLEAPETRSSEVATPFVTPVNPGRPLFRRIGVYVATGLVVGVIIAGALDGDTSLAAAEVGDCIDVDRVDEVFVSIVSCGDSPDAVVIATESSSGNCPARSDIYFRREPSDFVCARFL